MTTEPVNCSLDPNKTKNDDDASGASKKRMLFIIVAIVAAIVLGALVFGTVSAFTCGSDRTTLQDDIKSKDTKIKTLSGQLADLKTRYEAIRLDNIRLTKRNTELEYKIDVVEDDNSGLKRQVAAKTLEIEGLNRQLKVLNETVKEKDRMILSLQDTIDQLNEGYDELNSNVRMIVGILNQELNNNQALKKQIDSQAEEIQRLGHVLGAKTNEVLKLKEDLNATQEQDLRDWMRAAILEKQTGKEISLELVYTNSLTECGSMESYYNKIKNISPNVFVATEKASGRKFGGFTTQTWTEGEFKRDEKAFTFSFTNRGTCAIKNVADAIFTNRKLDNKLPMITFGRYDIMLGQNCIQESNHAIDQGKTFACPSANFYTDSAKPTLNSFAFYKVILKDKPYPNA